MKTIRLPNDSVPFENGCIALGNFDGVHKGHQKVIATCMEYARKKGVPSGVYTFSKHPKTIFRHFDKVVTHSEVKEVVLETLLNPDWFILQDIDEDFLCITPEEFVKNVLKDTLKVSAVVVGEHYSFGKKGRGDTELLKALCAEQNIEVVVVPLMYEDGVLLSSTHVRELISKGDMEGASKVLGYDFFVMGEVVHGNHIGNTLGYPTINIEENIEQILPVFGVYASVAEIDGIKYESVSNVGMKPTVGTDKPLIETHIFGIDADLYGKKAKIFLKKQLRTEKRFSGLDELQAQIRIDSEKAKAYFSKAR